LFGNKQPNPDFSKTNNGNAGSTRYNYFLRYPFAQSAWNSDDRAPIGQSATAAGTGNAGGNRRDPVTGALGSTAQQGSGGSTGSSTERSLLNEAPTPLPAYLPMSYPGTYIPSLIALDMPLAKRDNEIFKNQMTTYGLWMSDTQFQALERENFQRQAELLLDP